VNGAHRRFLELAAASIDFELSPSERDELRTHLSTCDTCPRALDGMRADARTIRALPARDVAVDRSAVILRRALGRPPDLASLRLVVLAAVLALLAVGLVVVGSELLRPPETPVLPRPTGPQPTTSQATQTSGPSLPANAWQAVGSMAEPRGGHTATLLPDGRVLVAGGTGIETLQSAELYLPGSRSWEVAGDLQGPRSGHVAIALPDGEVLVIGGSGPGGFPATSEIFMGDAWTTGPDLVNARITFAAVVTARQVVVIGGMFGDGVPRGEVEVWDLDGGPGFVEAAPLGTPRVRHTATVLADGSVLVVGGVGPAGDDVLASAELFDPSTGAWRPAAPMDVPRYDHTATRLPDGRVLVAGGRAPAGGLVDSVAIYDPPLDSWSEEMPLADGRGGHAAALIGDRGVLVVGGFGDPDAITSAEWFDLQQGSWSSRAPLLRPRREVVLVQLSDGSLLVVGGDSSKGGDTSEVELLSGSQGL
jgi:N-acetylneuraminic acid mutarotase